MHFPWPGQGGHCILGKMIIIIVVIIIMVIIMVMLIIMVTIIIVVIIIMEQLFQNLVESVGTGGYGRMVPRQRKETVILLQSSYNADLPPERLAPYSLNPGMNFTIRPTGLHTATKLRRQRAVPRAART